MSIIQCKNVSLIKEKKLLLEEITWTVEKHQHWAILGLNGAGKTLLLQIITGYLWPSSGEVTVLDQTFGSSSIPDLQRRIGWVSTALQQRIRGNDTSERIILSGKFASIGIYERFSEEDMEKAKRILIQSGGASLIGKSYQILSQGERQLVLICRALMAEPELLILDEPCNGLDLFAREKLLEQIRSIAEAKDSPTLLYVSHHTEEILPCFQHLLLLKNGKIVRQGLRSELFNEEILTDFYNEPIQLLSLGRNRLAAYPK
ncbi:ABC transporter ATP-binding protein [Enterococcus sp. BWR-S5]|uniref:ABC transporter ATP-binding protein n=1 Tax=Enterococcus sp. BWR-S5 TaxID=2787714 RepID=UPI0019217374|nr:ABC transporter ATP-binding protein [Enterococcus sp. BWR-S5]MBL1225679.1 ABC transporter ATP-binding protein [Enterococcus sp. BWR-S5]